MRKYNPKLLQYADALVCVGDILLFILTLLSLRSLSLSLLLPPAFILPSRTMIELEKIWR